MRLTGGNLRGSKNRSDQMWDPNGALDPGPDANYPVGGQIGSQYLAASVRFQTRQRRNVSADIGDDWTAVQGCPEW